MKTYPHDCQPRLGPLRRDVVNPNNEYWHRRWNNDGGLSTRWSYNAAAGNRVDP